MDTDPVWFKNIMANPHVDIMIGGITKNYSVHKADPDEKRNLWPHLVSLYPGFDEYQARTDRDIPVLVCEPVGGV
jgi:deazaflavin-dependent oxidoreductase (nitroreductase family)